MRLGRSPILEAGRLPLKLGEWNGREATSSSPKWVPAGWLEQYRLTAGSDPRDPRNSALLPLSGAR